MRKGLFAITLALALLCAPAAQAALTWSPAAHDFGSQESGVSSAPVTFTLTATCDTADMAMVCTSPLGGAHNYMSVDAPGADFNVDSTTCSGLPLVTATLASLDSCSARVAFKPSSTGPKTGTLQTGNGEAIALLSGNGANTGDKKGSGNGKKCKKKKKKKSNSATAAKKKKKCKKKKKK